MSFALRSIEGILTVSLKGLLLLVFRIGGILLGKQADKHKNI